VKLAVMPVVSAPPEKTRSLQSCCHSIGLTPMIPFLCLNATTQEFALEEILGPVLKTSMVECVESVHLDGVAQVTHA
jgi:hypothetical protein